MTANRRWTEDEEDAVLEFLTRAAPRTIGRRIGRTAIAVERFCDRKGYSPLHQDLLTVREAAAHVGCTPESLYKAVREGRLSARKLPGKKHHRILLDPDDLPTRAGRYSRLTYLLPEPAKLTVSPIYPCPAAVVSGAPPP